MGIGELGRATHAGIRPRAFLQVLRLRARTGLCFALGRGGGLGGWVGWGVGEGGGGDDDDIVTRTPRTISPREPFHLVFTVLSCRTFLHSHQTYSSCTSTALFDGPS